MSEMVAEGRKLEKRVGQAEGKEESQSDKSKGVAVSFVGAAAGAAEEETRSDKKRKKSGGKRQSKRPKEATAGAAADGDQVLPRGKHEGNFQARLQ